MEIAESLASVVLQRAREDDHGQVRPGRLLLDELRESAELGRRHHFFADDERPRADFERRLARHAYDVGAHVLVEEVDDALLAALGESARDGRTHRRFAAPGRADDQGARTAGQAAAEHLVELFVSRRDAIHHALVAVLGGNQPRKNAKSSVSDHVVVVATAKGSTAQLRHANHRALRFRSPRAWSTPSSTQICRKTNGQSIPSGPYDELGASVVAGSIELLGRSPELCKQVLGHRERDLDLRDDDRICPGGACALHLAKIGRSREDADIGVERFGGTNDRLGGRSGCRVDQAARTSDGRAFEHVEPRGIAIDRAPPFALERTDRVQIELHDDDIHVVFGEEACDGAADGPVSDDDGMPGDILDASD